MSDEIRLLYRLYAPIGDDVYVDVRIFGPGPLTARHIETFIRYLDITMDALTPAPPPTLDPERREG